MTNGTDPLYRSRKWILARSLVRRSTELMLVGWLCATALLWTGRIDGAMWVDVVKGGWTFWWLAAGTVATGYGFANVAQKIGEARANGQNGGE